MVAVACRLAGTKLMLSLGSELPWSREFRSLTGCEVVTESAESLATRLGKMTGGTVRFMGEYDAQVMAPDVIGNLPIVRSEVLANGRIEMLNYLREQSMTQIVHRYGNIL